MRPLRSLTALALLALPAPLAAQALDSLLMQAVTRGRERLQQLAGAGARPDGGARQYQEAVSDLAAGRWADAALSLQAAMQRNRNNPLYHFELGYAYARQTQWDQAGDAFAAAARLQSQNAFITVALAAVRAAQQRWADAAGIFQLAAQTDSSVVDFAFASIAAQSFEAAGDRTRAAEWYRQAAALRPDDANPWLRLAIIYRQASDTARGVEASRRLLALRPDDGLGNAIYATFLSEMGQSDSAVAYADRAARDSLYRPTAAEVYLQAGAGYLRARDLVKAAEVLRRGQPLAAAELREPYGFYLGMAELQQMNVRLNDLQEHESCDGTRGLDSMLTRIEDNLRTGRSADTLRADRALNLILPGYRTNAQQMAQRYCDPARLRRAPARQAPPRRRP